MRFCTTQAGRGAGLASKAWGRGAVSALLAALSIIWFAPAAPAQAVVAAEAVVEQSAADAFAPAVTLLPDSTQGFLEFQDLPALTERWRRTSLADLQHDPAMRDFLETQRDVIETKLSELGVKAGLRLSDLQEAISGELVLAWMRYEAPERPFAVAMLADARGRDTERQSLLTKIDKSLRERGATVSRQSMRDFQATVYNLPQKKGQLGVERLNVIDLNGRVIISDRTETLAGLVSAAIDGRQRGLVNLDEFQQVFQSETLSKVEVGAEGEALPMVRWFARPIEMGMILRELAGVDRGDQVDILQLLSEQGFDVLKSVGGHVYLATENYDLLHRAYMFAPPTGPENARYQGAAKMLQFPNSSMESVPKWVLPTAATIFQMNWKTEDAFWSIGSLVDAAMGEDVFETTLEGVREEENLDIAGDVVANMLDHVIVMTDNTIIGDQMRERVVGAIPLKNIERVTEVMNRTLEREPNIFPYDYPGHQIWELHPQESESIELDVEDPFRAEFGVDDLDDEPGDFGSGLGGPAANQQPLVERGGITVFNGYLMFASHAELLVDLVEHAKQGEGTFAEQEAFRRVRAAIDREGGEQRCMERIIRTGLAWRIKYDLIREGKFLESDSLLAGLFRRLLERAEQAESENPANQPVEIDTSKLPPFKAIQHHMQPGGGFMRTTEEGWVITQFLLRKPTTVDAPANN